MSKLKFTAGIAAIALAFMGLQACKDGGKTGEGVKDDQVNGSTQREVQMQKEENEGRMAAADEGFSSPLIRQYLILKDALADDDSALATTAAKKFNERLDAIDMEELTQEKRDRAAGILEQARRYADRISGNDGIAEQREQFEQLSINMISLVALTGSDTPLYEQYCPMYNNNKGGVWLSSSEIIQNPYFGSSMLRCGTVRREYN